MDDRTRGEQKPATAARIYDFFIGGTHNFPADRAAAAQIIAQAPRSPVIARANRAFLQRAVRRLTEDGVRQFLDIGAGIPTGGNVHEIAQAVAPDARVVYVDIDPVAVAEGLEILENNADATAILGDLRDVPAILSHPDVGRLIDFDRPVAVLLCAVLHFMTDDDDARAAVRALRDALAPGSYLVISHATMDQAQRHRPDPHVEEEAVQAVYTRQTATPFRLRTYAEVAAFFDGFDLIDPGLVWLAEWSPEPGDAAEFRDEPHLSSGWVGVGRKGSERVAGRVT